VPVLFEAAPPPAGRIKAPYAFRCRSKCGYASMGSRSRRTVTSSSSSIGSSAAGLQHVERVQFIAAAGSYRGGIRDRGGSRLQSDAQQFLRLRWLR
jgi:hypothetical protein